MRKIGCFLLLLLSSVALAAAPGELLTKALEFIQTGRYALARSYLDPLVIDPRLSPAQRASAYYYRGYTYFAEQLPVSALHDYNRALQFDPSNATVQAAIAQMYVLGAGVPRDAGLAFDLFLKAARGGHQASQAYVGWALLTGRGVEQNVPKARYWLTEAADAGDLNALNQLARSFRAPFAEEPDPERAAALYRDAVGKGSVDAEVALGYMQLNGELGTSDPSAAIEQFRSAADHGSAAARTALAYAYLTGRGVPQDLEKARTLYAEAAAQGNAAAYLGLAHMYENGLGTPSDLTKARELYGKAAELGDTTAQLKSAALLLRANANLEDTRAALELFLAAAERGAAEGHNGAAWLMATSRHEDLRDGDHAVQEAERAVALASSPMTLDTLAAAHAERGDFEQAIALQREALAALPADSELAEELQAHLDAYLRNQPWRE